ncbi:LPS export ABC transporter permease LptF, partial [Burkholderia thailandensis]|uniref:LptF/LptG family permease n=1 Tax=Burkholderia thailandensis TaxID=57975 RepID=UPI002A741C56|nr:LPS export ABC transporter permease LptF [Burkholderia thailandensis]
SPNGNLAGLRWCAGLPLIAINLVIRAIALGYQNPRRGRTVNLVMAVLISLTYSNLLNVVQSQMERGTTACGLGLIGLHVIVAGIVALLFWLRVRNRPLFSRAAAGRSQGA